MAIVKGILGSVKLTTNVVAELQDWSLEMSQEFIDTTSFHDTMKESTPTWSSWSATASGNWDISDTNWQLALQTAFLAGSTATPLFYTNGSNYYTGLAYVTANISASVSNMSKISYTFTGAGALTYA